MMCLQYYGNVVMDSHILDVNESFILGYLLKHHIQKKEPIIEHFKFTRICSNDENPDVFDSKYECFRQNSLVVCQTNFNDVILIVRMGGQYNMCLMRSAIESEFLWSCRPKLSICGDAYHVPKDLDLQSCCINVSDTKQSEEVGYLPQISDAVEITVKDFELFFF